MEHSITTIFWFKPDFHSSLFDYHCPWQAPSAVLFRTRAPSRHTSVLPIWTVLSWNVGRFTMKLTFVSKLGPTRRIRRFLSQLLDHTRVDRSAGSSGWLRQTVEGRIWHWAQNNRRKDTSGNIEGRKGTIRNLNDGKSVEGNSNSQHTLYAVKHFVHFKLRNCSWK